MADAQTGEVLWKYGSGGPVNAAAVVVNGAVHWGSGYPHFGFVGNNTFYVSARSNETNQSLRAPCGCAGSVERTRLTGVQSAG